jgi:hypothetical protein
MAFYHDIENDDAPACEGVSTTHALRAATTAKKRGKVTVKLIASSD